MNTLSDKVVRALESVTDTDADLSGCEISTLGEIVLMLPTSTETLDLTKNNLTNVGEGISRLKELRHLFLGYNKIEKIPDFIFNLENLQTLSIKRNSLKFIPDGISRLKNLVVLNVSHNQLTRMPESIGDMRCLQDLIVYGNSFDFLPTGLSKISPRIDIDDARLLVPIYATNPYWKEATVVVPESLRTPIIQYLEFFNDFFKATRGREVIFEVNRAPSGICVRVSDEKVEEVEDALHFYMSCVAQLTGSDQENFPPEIRTVNDIKNAMFVQELRNQIRFLQMQVENKNIAISMLNHQLQSINTIALAQASRPVALNVSNLMTQSNHNYVSENPFLFECLNDISNILMDMRGLTRDSFVENELEKLGIKIEQAKNAKNEEGFKKIGLINSLQRFLEKSADMTSNLGKTMTSVSEISEKIVTLKEVLSKIIGLFS